MRKAIVFDMDGVLVNSEYAMRAASIEALIPYGIEAKHEDFFEFTGMGEDKFIGGVVEKHGGVYTENMKDEAYAIYCQRAMQTVETSKDIRATLLRLKEEGYRMAVASAADAIKVRTNIAVIGVEPDFFEALVTGNDVLRKKPAPDCYLLAAERLGVDPSECIVFEDAVGGVQAAVAAGMYPIGITSTFDAETLRAAGARLTLDGVYAFNGIDE